MLGKRQSSQVFDVVKLVLLGICAVLLLVGVAQLDNLEEHVLKLEQRLDELESRGTGSAKVQKEVKADDGEGRTWLHPKVPNALFEDPFDLISDDAVYGGTLTTRLLKEPTGLNHIVNFGGSMMNATEHYVHERLADYHNNDPDKFAPRLAQRIEITDDFKEYTIYLRKGVKWHAPVVDSADPKYKWLSEVDREFTAKDVKFTLEMFVNPQVEAKYWRNYYKDIEYCKIIDKHTLVIRWKKKTFNSIEYTFGIKPIPEFLYSRDESGNPIPAATVGLAFNEHWYNNRAIGTGPYKYLSWKKGQFIEFGLSNEYWGEKPPIEKIRWLVNTNTNSVPLKMKSGQLDVASLSALKHREEIIEGKPDSPFRDGRINHDFYDKLMYSFIGWNQANPIFADKRVRRAMTMCLDRRSVLENIFMGLGQVVTGPFYYKSPYADSSVPSIPFDLEASKGLLKEAGWSDSDEDGILDKKIDGKQVDFKFTLLMISGYPQWRDMAVLFKEALYKIGVEMNIAEVEWGVYMKMRNDRDFDAMLGFWGLYWFTDPYGIWHSSQADMVGGNNFIGFKNEKADILMDKLRETFDPDSRVELCHKIHRVIHGEQPYMFLFTRKKIMASWNHVKRVMFRPIPPHELSLPWYLEK